MHWIVILQLLVSALYVGYLIHCYSLKTVGWFVKVSVYLTWLICFSNVVVLPYDIYFSLHQDFTMGVVWKTSYFLIFFLTWVLLPIAQQYQGAGEFSIGQKLKRAIINNLIIYGIFVLIGIAGFAYLVFVKKVDLSNLPPLLLAASNAFGMFLLVIFLSYGLVKIPKEMWRCRNYKLILKSKQFSVSLLARKKQSVLHELELRAKQILWKIKKEGQSPETVSILNLIPSQYLDKWNRNIPDLGKVDSIKAHKQIKQSILELGRLQSRWEQITISAFKTQDILTYMNAHDHRIDSTIFDHYQYDILNFFQWLWHCRLKKWLIPLGSILLSIFAVAIVIAEVTVFIPKISVINPFSHITSIKDFVPMDLVLLGVLSYVAFCIYYALFKLKFSNFYGLYWNQQTDAASLIFFAINCSRISNALNYNFLQVVNDDESSFVKSMGQTNVFPVFGDTFRFVFPVLLILLILFNAFDVYQKICKMLGLSKFQFQNQFSHENIDEGKRLLQKARADLENKILNNNCRNLKEFRSYQFEVSSVSYSSQVAPTVEQISNSTSSSSEKIHLKGAYFNQYRSMRKAQKIFNM